MNNKIAEISTQDAGIRQMINLRFLDQDNSTGVITVPLAPCTYSNILQDVWRQVLHAAPSAQPGSLSKYQRYVYREIDSEVPVVWTTCLTNESVTYADVVDKVSDSIVRKDESFNG